MKNNIYGIIISVICIINILFMIYTVSAYDMGLNNNIYVTVGTIISIILLILLFKNNVYGYIGTIIFYGIQMLGTELIFENFRYGLILRNQSELKVNSAEFQWDFNYTAILVVILAVLGYFQFKKLTKKGTEKLNNEG